MTQIPRILYWSTRYSPLSTLRTQRNSINLRVLLDDKDRRVSISPSPLPPFPPGRGIFVGGLFRPLLPRSRGRRGLGDERASAYSRSVNLLCTLPQVPFATWQGWLNSYRFCILFAPIRGCCFIPTPRSPAEPCFCHDLTCGNFCQKSTCSWAASSAACAVMSPLRMAVNAVSRTLRACS